MPEWCWLASIGWSACASRVLMRPRCLPIPSELQDTLVCERVMDHMRQDSERYRGDVGTGERSLSHVGGVPDRSSEDLGGQVIGLDHRDEVTNDLHAVLVDVVQTADKRGQPRRRPTRLPFRSTRRRRSRIR